MQRLRSDRQSLWTNGIYMNVNDHTALLVLALEAFFVFLCDFIERRYSSKIESKVELRGPFNGGPFVLIYRPGSKLKER